MADMTITTMLYKLILGPLVLLFDVVFKLAYRTVTHAPGPLIVFLSLTMNLLLLPMYRRADAIQEEDRRQSMRLQKGLEHIRKTFRGNERFMMQQTYYRQNHYKPWYALKGSLSLLLEVPFFIAAYNYLSHLQLIQGVAFGPVHDLGAPDGLLHIAGRAINLLPVLMTGINIVSGAIYTKGMPLRSKLQLYGMALVFLFFLYDSPSGLVFYWTLNNLFSLVKNLFTRLRDPKKAIARLCSLAGIGLLALVVLRHARVGLSRRALLLMAALGLQLPLALYHRGKKRPAAVVPETRGDRLVFYAGCAFLTLLLGALIPLGVIKSSPTEFIDITHYSSSLNYVLSALLTAAGTFLVWFSIFYHLSGAKVRRAFSYLVAAASAVAVLDYTGFGGQYGTMTSELQYDSRMNIAKSRMAFNLLAVLAVMGLVYLIWKKRQQLIRIVGIAACVAVLGLSVSDAAFVEGQNRELLKTVDVTADRGDVRFPLDTRGRNVVVIMLDRGLSCFIPYIFQEKPELKQRFAGFTYYPNTLSYGTATNVGAPALFGGYEYTPQEIDRRSDEPLRDKHDEALKVMPALFYENGYDVTVCDPPYAGYGNVPDLSIFDAWPGMNTYITMTARAIDDDAMRDSNEALRHRNFFCYSVFRAAPLALHRTLYDGGQYNEMDAAWTQVLNGLSRARGVNYGFMKSYSVLSRLPEYAEIRSEGRNTFMMIDNETTHAPMLLAEPGYTPDAVIDNTAFDAAHAVRCDADGHELRMTTERQVRHYHINMAAMLKLADWFDDMRAKDVYDNTRIILVADHGTGLSLFDRSMSPGEDLLAFNPLLMVKDFNADAFTVDDRFMTNADTPLLALDGLVEHPVNPFTGKPLTDDKKHEPEQLVAHVIDFKPFTNNGNTFKTLHWYANKNDPLNLDAWRRVEGDPE